MTPTPFEFALSEYAERLRSLAMMLEWGLSKEQMALLLDALEYPGTAQHLLSALQERGVSCE